MDYIEFGKYLTQQRQLRGMSRDEVSRATKIPPTLVVALETGQVERLPERIFVINYIRSYAAVIGLSAEDAVLRFEEVDKVPLALPSGTSVEPPASRRRAFRFLLVAVVLVALAAILYVLVSGPHAVR